MKNSGTNLYSLLWIHQIIEAGYIKTIKEQREIIDRQGEKIARLLLGS